MDGKGRATDNAIIERWFRTIKQKYIYLNPPQTGLSLFHGIKKFVEKSTSTEDTRGLIAKSQWICISWQHKF